MSNNKPAAQTIFPWLRSNLGKRCLAPLTSQDSKALMAAVQIIELYAYDHDQSVLEAFQRVVLRMQPHTQELAYHAIAHVMDWSDRRTIWDAAMLPLPHLPMRICAFEPDGTHEEAA